jgi:hypothetical protein
MIWYIVGVVLLLIPLIAANCFQVYTIWNWSLLVMMPLGLLVIVVNAIYRCDYIAMIIAVIIILVGYFLAKNFTAG